MGVAQAFNNAVLVFPSQQNLRGGTSLHGQLGADRDGFVHAGGACRGCRAYAPVALAAVQLGGFVSFEAELLQNRVCHGDELIGNGGGREFGQAGAEHEASLHVTGYEAVVSQRHGEAVRGGACQTGCLDEVAQGYGACLEAVKNEGCLVEHANAGGAVGVYLYHLLVGGHVFGRLDRVDNRCVVVCGCVGVTHSVCVKT